MRHFLRIICVFIFAFLAVFNASSATEDVVVGDFTYTITSTYIPTTANTGYLLNTAVLTGHNNPNLRSLQIPTQISYDDSSYTVVEIGESAFSGCSSLTGSLKIPESVTSIGDKAFYNCSNFTGPLIIGNSVTSIGNSAFYHCRSFTGPLTIPSSVISIGNNAFDGCWNFTGPLTIPESVKSIGNGAFLNCWSLTGPLVISDAVISIGGYAFSFCDGLTGSLTIPNSVTEIGGNAFRGCSGFTGTLTIGNSVISIGDGAFDGCSGLTGPLTIPETVTSIGDRAFYDCSGFTGSLTIGSAVNRIGENAFSNCSGFTGSLTIPESVISIGDKAFYNCSGFTGSLTIGSSVETIGKNTFYDCGGFTGSLTIGKSVTSIDDSAFKGCDNFESIKSLNPEPPLCLKTSLPSNTDIIIRVPAGSGVTYRCSSGWLSYSNIYEIGDVNHSEKITVSDAVADANYIIGIEPAGTFDEICGDMNLDGRVSLLDVSQIIDAVSEYNPDDMDVIVRAESRVPAMTNGELKVLRSNNGISGITVACDYDVTAFQCDIHADGIRPEDIILDNSLEATHSLTVSQINDDTVRVIIFSMESATIDKSEKIIWLDINNTSEIEIKNIIAADPNALEYNLANVIAPGVTSNIDYVDLESCGLSFRDGCLNVSGAIGKQLNVYDISGKTVYSSTIVSDDYSVSLAPGLYIVAIDSYKTKLIVDK